MSGNSTPKEFNFKDIFRDIDEELTPPSSNLNNLDAANYLNSELLQQIELLQVENQQLRDENGRLNFELSTFSKLPSIDSGYPRTHEFAPSSIAEHTLGEDALGEEGSSTFSESHRISPYRIEQHNVTSDLARVQHCQQKINSLEREAEEARTQNRALMTEFSGKLKQKSRALGSTLDRTRPYFEARKKSARTRSHAEKLSNDYHQTILMLKNARDVVKQRIFGLVNILSKVAEEQMAEFPLEPQWLEMLNEANEKAQTAIFQRDKIHSQHRKATEIYSRYDKVAKRMEKESESAIKKCEDYFHLRDEFERLLEENGKHLRAIEVQLVDAKASLTSSLQQLGRQRPRAEDEASRTVSPQIRSSSSNSVVMPSSDSSSTQLPLTEHDFDPFDEWIED